MTEDHQLAPDVRTVADDNPVTIAERVPDPRGMSQECLSMQAAGRPSDQALDDIVKVEAIDGMRTMTSEL
ncbi:hypothetical protein BJA01nite_13050 [Bradyrhizobium japonicum]|nr:hypothetical protein BJA01nite_13050 [Bradyrhizobium japonicum]